MNKIIKKYNNNEILSSEDLIRISKYYLKDLKCKKELSNNFSYDYEHNIIYILKHTNSQFFEKEFNEYLYNFFIKKIFNEKDIDINNKNILSIKNNKVLNLLLINATLHEVRHCMHEDILNNKYKSYDIDFLKFLAVSRFSTNNLLRNKYHDKLYYEYDANLSSALMVNDFNKTFLNTKEIEIFNSYACFKILKSYLDLNNQNILSPKENNDKIFNISNTYEIINHIINTESLQSVISKYKYMDCFNYLQNKEENINKTFYNRIKNGDKLKIEELQILKNIYLNNTKSNDLYENLNKKI